MREVDPIDAHYAAHLLAWHIDQIKDVDHEVFRQMRREFKRDRGIILTKRLLIFCLAEGRTIEDLPRFDH